MPWWGFALAAWLAPSVLFGFYLAGLVAYNRWRLTVAVERTDRLWAERHGIDMHTTYARFLPGERLP